MASYTWHKPGTYYARNRERLLEEGKRHYRTIKTALASVTETTETERGVRSTKDVVRNEKNTTASKAWYWLHREEVLARARVKYAERKAELNGQVKRSIQIKKECLASRPRPTACEICERERRIVWDHDHETGLFRGWLCISCNYAVGQGREKIALLRKMIEYLERSTMPG